MTVDKGAVSVCPNALAALITTILKVRSLMDDD